MKSVINLLSKAPSWVWVLLFPLGIIAFVGSILVTFFLLANVEGFATILFLAAGWLMAVGLVSQTKASEHPLGAAVTGGLICFYALMGMAIDQPGNYIFNKPVEWWLCPPNTVLQRGVDVSHPLPGRTDITQDFRCHNAQGELVDRPSLPGVITIRFFEYVLVAYAFMGLRKLQLKLKSEQVTS